MLILYPQHFLVEFLACIFFTKLMESFKSPRLKFGNFVLWAICNNYKFGAMVETSKVVLKNH